jgi:cyclopropane-fatty-acyl-phospholipid synthase
MARAISTISSIAAQRRGVASELAELIIALTHSAPPVRLRAWDDSEVGPADGPVLVLHDRAALRRMLWHPRELGLAQAFIAGEADVEGDLGEVLSRLLAAVRQAREAGSRPDVRLLSRGIAVAARLRCLGPCPPAPLSTPRLRRLGNSREKDQTIISYHYDLSNEFFQLILDPSMAYSCAHWNSRDPGYCLAEAQRDKLELVCARLALKPGMRLLDIGCGWGSLSLYAARNHGAQVTAITLSQQQFSYVGERVAELSLGELVDVRLQHYLDVHDGPYDAVAVIEMGEHVGRRNYPDFAARLTRLAGPGARVLVQQMSRDQRSPGGGSFIATYIAADMHMRPMGETVAALERAGLEVREVEAMREHYVRTIMAWQSALEQRWDDVINLVGEPTGRVWRLYLAGAALAFAERRMGVDQILAVKPVPS